MNILHITTHLNAGGITSYILSLTREYMREGHQVYVASSGGDLEDQFLALGAELWNFDIRVKSDIHPKLFRAILKLNRLIPQKSIDVIHGHTRVTQVMTSILGRLTHRAYVTTCHGFYKTRWSRMVFPCWGEAAIAISPLVQEHLIKDFHTPPSRVFLIPHGVHIPQFSPMPLKERRTGLQARNVLGHPAIGIIARLADIKGHDVLIRAMPRVLEKLPKAQLVIVGTGKMEQKLHTLVDELGLKAQVLFFSVTHCTAEFMPLFDLFVLPSIEEGLGLSVLEAQACGLPVVASDVGGLKTLIKTGSTGILVEPGRSDQLAEAILDILSNPERAEAMGQAARRFIKQNHSAPRMAKETLAVYQHVLEHKKNR